jgi:hypothetical protein
VSARADVYRAAAADIREHGLAKGDYVVGASHCTVGALQSAALTHPEVNIQREAHYLAGLLGLDTGRFEMHYGVAYWNDREETTADDVVTLLEQAAEKLEADQ